MTRRSFLQVLFAAVAAWFASWLGWKTETPKSADPFAVEGQRFVAVPRKIGMYDTEGFDEGGPPPKLTFFTNIAKPRVVAKPSYTRRWERPTRLQQSWTVKGRRA